ncbi:MAG: Hsp20/alpha crystallin family protein [Methanoregula sp.]|nr:Hsp20/alpha crystallin family protein [Methanoregula sp.]
MNDDAQDIFREMDTLADHLFARMARDFGTGMPQGFSYHVVIQNGGNLLKPREEYDSISPRSGTEPIPEVHLIDDEVMVIAELPGATKETVKLSVMGNELVIDADGGVRQYHTTAALPPVDPGSMQTSIKNGVLEVKFKML